MREWFWVLFTPHRDRSGTVYGSRAHHYMTPTTFEALPLAEPIQRALLERKYTTPTPIQAQSIPHLLNGRDLLGCAQTGTGKTAAFSLPILNALYNNSGGPKAKTTRVLVLTPTRELATQVGKSLETYGSHLRFRHTLVYGGVGQRPQVTAMQRGVDVLVACPGRLLDLIDQGHLNLSGVEFFVLDEVDRMLDMGFQRDVTRIVSMLPKKRQSLFFSATLAPSIVKLAHGILNNPVTVSIAPETTTADSVEQRVCFLERENKRALLLKLLAGQKPGELTIVFSRTKHGSNKLAHHVTNAGFNAEAIHGNRSQPQREKTLDRFRKGLVPVLVATDVAARGVDVKSVTLVVNFDLPNEPEAYIHRIGRTGRAGATGHAVSFCAEDERENLQEIEKLIQEKIQVDDTHQWHLASLAEQHARGVRAASGKKKSGGGNNRGGRNRAAGGGDGAGNKPGGGRRRRRPRRSAV